MSFIAESLGKLSHWMLPPGPGKKNVYHLSEGSINDESILSHKGAVLCELNRLGFNVPPAFVLPSNVSFEYHKSDAHDLSPQTLNDIKTAVDTIAHESKHVFGSVAGPPPLLLSVRGGALASVATEVSFEENFLDSVGMDIVDILGAPDSWCIPGVKESCLGIGMNDQVAAHLASISNPFIAYNTYAHFLVRFGTIVLGVPRRHYRRVLNEHVESTGRAGVNLTREDLMNIVDQFKLLANVPADPFTQLHMTIAEMYNCWFSPAAMDFRAEGLNIDKTVGTAVIVQAIVFGGTGLCFTRSPVTGVRESGVFGTYWAKTGEKMSLNAEFAAKEPKVFQLLEQTSATLEAHFRDMQQYEFVYSGEDNLLYLLNVATGRRSPKASVKVAVDMVEQRLVTERDALLRIDASKSHYFMQRHLTPDQLGSAPYGTGLAASRGVVTGPLVFSSAECMERSLKDDVILCVHDCFPADARALRAAAAVITMGGNIFTNTAILCRGMGKPCITGTRNLALTQKPDGDGMVLTNMAGERLTSGDIVTVDGGSGKIFTGLFPTVSLVADVDFQTVLNWCDKFRRLRVNALVTTLSDMVEQVKWARDLGADGLGCISTDGMFKSTEDRLNLTRSILIRHATVEKAVHLQLLGELHREDFRLVFRTAQDRAVTVKLLDAPLGSFLPTEMADMVAFAEHGNVTVADVKRAVAHMEDADPDMGLRGCRIAAFYPEVIEMQVRSIISATLDLAIEGLTLTPKILVPMLCTAHELEATIALVNRVAFQVYEEYKQAHPALQTITKYYDVGAVWSSARACLRAETMAPMVSSVAVSTGDLTASVFACGRADAEKFFPQYIFDKIYLADPFASLDDMGVGQLISLGLDKFRKLTPTMDCSIIDTEHTSDPRSIEFLNQYGVHAIVCPPARIPIARICAAQTEIRATKRAEQGDLEEEYEEYFLNFP